MKNYAHIVMACCSAQSVCSMSSSCLSSGLLIRLYSLNKTKKKMYYSVHVHVHIGGGCTCYNKAFIYHRLWSYVPITVSDNKLIHVYALNKGYAPTCINAGDHAHLRVNAFVGGIH